MLINQPHLIGSPTETKYKAMTYVLVRHKVADFSKWKAEYDAYLPTRQKAGLEEEHLLRNIDNPDEVVLLYEAENLHEAQAFARSSDLREAMQKAGVVDKPDIYFLA
jgi:hypothetical protein